MFCTLVIFAMGCSPMLTVNEDFDQSTDFRKYKTFDWMPEDSQPDPRLSGVHKVDIDMEVKTALDKYLTEKGFTRDTASPDVRVAYRIGAAQTVYTSNWSADYWQMVGMTQTESLEDAYFFIDLVDAKTEERIWRGTGKMAKNRDPSVEIIKKNIDRGIREVVAQYPPGSSKKY